jgi:hypothetical protein
MWWSRIDRVGRRGPISVVNGAKAISPVARH